MKEKVKRIKALCCGFVDRFRAKVAEIWRRWQETGLNLVLVTVHCIAIITGCVAMGLTVGAQVDSKVVIGIVFTVLLLLFGVIYFRICRFSVRNRKQLETLGIRQSLGQTICASMMFVAMLCFLLGDSLSKPEIDWWNVVIYSLAMVGNFVELQGNLQEVARTTLNVAALHEGLLAGLKEIANLYHET